MEVFTGGIKYTQLMPDAFQASLSNCTLINHQILDIVSILYIFLQYPVYWEIHSMLSILPITDFLLSGKIDFLSFFLCLDIDQFWLLWATSFQAETEHFQSDFSIPALPMCFKPQLKLPKTNWLHFINSPTQQF